MFATIPHQLTTAATAYWSRQFELYSALNAKALDNTKKLADLNLRTLHAAMERSSAALLQTLPSESPAPVPQAQLAMEDARAYARQVADLGSAMRAEYIHLMQGSLAAANARIEAGLDELSNNVPDGAANVVELIRATVGSVIDGCKQSMATSEQAVQAVASTIGGGNPAFMASSAKPAKRSTAH